MGRRAGAVRRWPQLLRSVATTAAGHVINSNDIRPGRSYQGRIIKVNGNTGATVWVKGPYADANYFYGVATIGEDTFFGAEHGTAGVTPFENGVTIPTASGSVSKLDAAGNYQWTVPLPSSRVGSRSRAAPRATPSLSTARLPRRRPARPPRAPGRARSLARIKPSSTASTRPTARASGPRISARWATAA